MATKSPLALFELASFVLQDVFGFGAFRGVQEQMSHCILPLYPRSCTSHQPDCKKLAEDATDAFSHLGHSQAAGR